MSLIVLACVMTMLTAPMCQAQDAPVPPQTRSSLDRLREPLISFHIAGGKITDFSGSKTAMGEEATLSNAVKLLQTKGLNIVMPEELGQIRINDLQLSDVPVELALEALSAASGNQFMFQRRQSSIPESLLLYIIEKKGQPGPPPPERTVQALNLTGYLRYMNLDVHSRHLIAKSGQDAKADENAKELDEVLTKLKEIIVNTIRKQGGTPLWMERDDSKKPEVTFYADADLLVVVGAPDELETVRKIVNALPGQNDGRIVGTATGPVGEVINDGARAHARSQAPAPATSQP